MATPNYIQKTLFMKPEVTKIFDDLDAWKDHCRFNLLKYDEKDLYKSREYKEWQRELAAQGREAKRYNKKQQVTLQ